MSGPYTYQELKKEYEKANLEYESWKIRQEESKISLERYKKRECKFLVIDPRTGDKIPVHFNPMGIKPKYMNNEGNNHDWVSYIEGLEKQKNAWKRPGQLGYHP